MNVSGQKNTDPTWWRDMILLTLKTMLSKRTTVDTNGISYTNLREILLQPVVGGPQNGQCAFPATAVVTAENVVRASFNHPYIDEGIRLAVIAASSQFPDVKVVAGMSAEVLSCSDYADSKGHLSTQKAVPIGKAIGQFYAN